MNMNRRNFIKFALGVLAVAATAPTTLLKPAKTEAATLTTGVIPRSYIPLEQVPMRPFSNMDFINRRRMALTIEKYLDYYRFEPNDSLTRKQISNCLNEFLEFAKNNNAIREYKVICDESNNSPEIIDSNECLVDIFIRPVPSPSQFSRLTFSMLHGTVHETM